MVSAEVEFLEERLGLLESWLESTKEDGNNDDLIEKREEYRGLIEETILLQKKLRKTIKLLSTEKNEKMLQKLAKKQDQYHGEIDEIMNYAETDVLFETAEIEPNELLGEPLETLMEQPGLEGSSSSLPNFSLDDFMPNVSKASQLSPSDQDDDFEVVAESNGTSNVHKNYDCSATFSTSSTSLFTASTGQSNANNYDERTLRRKLKKVQKLLAAEEVLINKNEPLQLDAIQIKKLNKKVEQYTQALQNVMRNGMPSSPTTNDDREHRNNPLSMNPNNTEEGLLVEDSKEEFDEIIYEEILEDEILEEEYIEEEIIEEEEELEYYESEEEDDTNREQTHDNHDVNDSRNQNSKISASYDRRTLKKKMKKLKKMMEGTSDATELELLKQKKKEYKLALQATKKQENGVKIPSQSRLSPQHELIETEESAPNEGGDEVYTNPSGSVHSHSQQSTGENFPSEEVNDVLINTLKKKLRKADKAIEKARNEDDPKKLKKMEKKRLEYQTSLDELLFTRR